MLQTPRAQAWHDEGSPGGCIFTFEAKPTHGARLIGVGHHVALQWEKVHQEERRACVKVEGDGGGEGGWFSLCEAEE